MKQTAIKANEAHLHKDSPLPLYRRLFCVYSLIDSPSVFVSDPLSTLEQLPTIEHKHHLYSDMFQSPLHRAGLGTHLLNTVEDLPGCRRGEVANTAANKASGYKDPHVVLCDQKRRGYYYVSRWQ